MSWLILRVAGGWERHAGRIINRLDGASYNPKVSADGKERLLLPGYVLATWLHEPPWQALEAHTTPRGLPLIFGALAQAGSETLARISQHDVDLMEAYANDTAREAGVIRYALGDIIPQKLGLTGAEVAWRVTEVRDEILTLQTVMLGRIIERSMNAKQLA